LAVSLELYGAAEPKELKRDDDGSECGKSSCLLLLCVHLPPSFIHLLYFPLLSSGAATPAGSFSKRVQSVLAGGKVLVPPLSVDDQGASTKAKTSLSAELEVAGDENVTPSLGGGCVRAFADTEELEVLSDSLGPLRDTGDQASAGTAEADAESEVTAAGGDRAPPSNFGDKPVNAGAKTHASVLKSPAADGEVLVPAAVVVAVAPPAQLPFMSVWGPFGSALLAVAMVVHLLHPFLDDAYLTGARDPAYETFELDLGTLLLVPVNMCGLGYVSRDLTYLALVVAICGGVLFGLIFGTFNDLVSAGGKPPHRIARYLVI
jgi:hypothetical protein